MGVFQVRPSNLCVPANRSPLTVRTLRLSGLRGALTIQLTPAESAQKWRARRVPTLPTQVEELQVAVDQ
eukprot:15434710-Alexandrium_andersonii.AAC.1